MTTPLATPATSDSSTLYFGPWYRRSPFFEKTLEAGCSAYDIYNHMYLPGYYADPIEEYWALLNDVTVWDVAVERIVEITGPDASAFTNMLTCRDLTKCAVGQGKYVLITAEDGGIVNDPVLLRVEADRWWLALADSDAGLWARGVAINSGMDVKVREPEVYPVQVQGPKSKDVMVALFGDAVLDIKYYWTLTTDLDGIPVVISRTGWTGEVGYEIYLRDPSRGGELWDRIMEAGRPHAIRPIAPCEARRIEAGIFNYGSDMTVENNPFEIMGLERLVEEQEADYIGKAALERIRARGVDRKLVGIEFEGDALPFEISRKLAARHDGETVGTVTDLIWSPRLGEEHRLRLGPVRALEARHGARDRGARRQALAGDDGRDPVHRPAQGDAEVLTGGRVNPPGRADRGSGTRPCARRDASRSPSLHGRLPPDRALRSGQGRPRSRRPPSADRGWRRGVRHGGYPSGAGPSRPRRIDDGVRATAAGAPARPACAPAAGAAARVAAQGSSHASDACVRARHRRGHRATPGSSPVRAGAGDGVPRAPAAGDALGVGPGNAPRARGRSGDSRRDRDIGASGIDGLPGRDDWRTDVRSWGSALST